MEAGKAVEPGHEQEGQGSCEDDGQPGDEDRFAEELGDYFVALCPGYFADADLFGPEGGAGGGEVHIVDASDQQDEDGDGAEDIDATDVAVLPDLFVEVGAEVDIGQALEEELGIEMGSGGRIFFIYGHVAVE